MKYIKKYNESSVFVEGYEDWDFTSLLKWSKDFIKGTYTENLDGSIDVNGNVVLHDFNLTKLPFNFRNVSGSFDCSFNKLTSLIGCPSFVGGSFHTHTNKLISLEYCPKIISGSMHCQNNELVDLYGCGDIQGDPIFFQLNPVYEIFKLCPTNDFIKYLNEFRPIRGKTILGKRLEECLYMCDVELDITKLKFKNYTLLE